RLQRPAACRASSAARPVGSAACGRGARLRCGGLAAAQEFQGGDALRALRAIEVLGNAGTAEAREVLEKLSLGEPEARQTEGGLGRWRSGEDASMVVPATEPPST